MKRHLWLVASLTVFLAACGKLVQKDGGSPAPATAGSPGALAATGTSTSSVVVRIDLTPPAATTGSHEYDAIFPYYAEFCAVSQIKKIPGHGVDVVGGYGGHGLMYIKGACRDMTVSYPRIKMCDSKDVGEQGVGVSLNSDFRNVSWTAIQSHDLLFNGLLKEGESVTPETYARAMAYAKELKLLDGIKFRPISIEERKVQDKDEVVTPSEFVWQDSFGTDYAVLFARSMYCARVPLERSEVDLMVHYLNSRNEYHMSGRDYIFSGPYNNCTHLTHNAIASTGFWDSYETNQMPLVQAFNLAVPYNDWVSLLKQGNDLDLEDVVSLFRDNIVRKSLLENNRLPTRPGVIGKYIGIHQPNELYETTSDALVLEVPLLKPIRRDMSRMRTDPRYTDLRANLADFQGRYRKALAALEPAENYLRRHQGAGERSTTSNISLRGDREEFLAFHAAYRKYLEQQLVVVAGQLEALDRAQAQTEMNLEMLNGAFQY